MKPTLTRKHRKPIFVVVIPRFEDLSNSFYAGEVTKGANIAASRLDVDILIHLVERSDHSHWLDGLLDPNFIDGMLFADIDRDWDVVRSAIRRGMPTMVLNNPTTEPFNTIAIDNRGAARKAVEVLTGLGHQRIATLSGDLDTQAGQDRLEGYYDGLETAGLPKEKKLAKKGEFLRSLARTGALALLKDKSAAERPTALFAASDVMAYEAIDVAKSLGLKVPEDLSVIGFDNNLSAGENGMKLATFEQPIVEMSRQGIENLYQMSLGLAKLPVKILMEAKYIKGHSTCQKHST
ncbi:MAG: substrate-binding domain-containing protein [Candidatus Omnitrophica bacterium]|nr:substrate-binding domain-containing protein [Candidatus Omnitrophota bacterium]